MVRLVTREVGSVRAQDTITLHQDICKVLGQAWSPPDQARGSPASEPQLVDDQVPLMQLQTPTGTAPESDMENHLRGGVGDTIQGLYRLLSSLVWAMPLPLST